jgi:pyruvate/2-oxoglutarate/acetoin dehydrogenase E1 component
MRTISIRCYNQSQSWHFEKVVAIGKKTFKVYIIRNAYDFQSYAKVYIYDTKESKWNQIVNAPITECECQKISYVTKDVNKSVFANDFERLLAEAKQITR